MRHRPGKEESLRRFSGQLLSKVSLTEYRIHLRMPRATGGLTDTGPHYEVQGKSAEADGRGSTYPWAMTNHRYLHRELAFCCEHKIRLQKQRVL